MLLYLDNALSAAPDRSDRSDRSDRTDVRRRQPQGLNENYARELLELHTLGADGGFSQDDVIQVARAFTGWTLAPPRLRRRGAAGGELLFRAGWHAAAR